MALHTTLNKIRSHSPCGDSWAKLLKHLNKTKADDEQLPFSVILESNGLDDTLWCCRSAPEYDKEWRLFAVWCARQVQHLMKDTRSIEALDVAERFANGKATQEELAAAGAAAGDAAGAAAGDAAWAAPGDAAWAAPGAAAWAAAGAAGDAAGDAARAAARAAGAAARAAAGAAARDAAWAAARDAARAAARDAARAAAGDAQLAEFKRIIKN